MLRLSIISISILFAPRCLLLTGEVDQTRELFQNRQAAIDLSDLRLVRITSAAADESWVLADVKIKRNYSTSNKFIPDPRTGELVPQGLISVTEGSVRVAAVLSGHADVKDWEYSRSTSEFARSGPPRKADSDPFVTAGGLVLLRISRPTGQAVDVRETCQLPAGWAKYIAPACRFCSEHPATFQEPPPDDEHRVAARNLLDNENPLLAIAAFRALCRTEDRIALVRGPFAHSRGVCRVVMGVLLLREAKARETRDLAVEFTRIVDAAKTPGELMDIAAAIQIAGKNIGAVMAENILLGTTQPEIIERLSVADRIQPTIFRRIRQCAPQLHPTTDSDRDLMRVLTSLGS
ncbi:MAG: hypothetical protein JWL69_4378 [Phycisphaerales bacterium]|nr:hypothetical protein [Phycisphaerales bacterium]MDB5355055.1 hypothetical protein [Phycisphaerales bacterium]